MISWYIESSINDSKYLEVVNRNVEPCMDYFCNRLSEVDEFNMNDILKVFREIVNELPILTFKTKENYVFPSNNYVVIEDDFWIRYNSYTIIRFSDGLKSIKREMVLSKILA